MALVPLDNVMPKDAPPDQPDQAQPPADQPPAEQPPAEQEPAQEPPDQEPDAQADQSSPGGQASPEEQKAVDTAMTAVGKLLFEDDASHARIMKTLEGGKANPAKAIGDVAVALTVQVDQASRGTIPRSCIVEIGKQTTEQVGQLANDSGLFKVDQAMLQKAGIAMLGSLADRYDVSPQEIQQFMSKFSPQEKEQARSSQDEIANGKAPDAPPQNPSAAPPAGGPPPPAQSGVVPPQGGPLG